MVEGVGLTGNCTIVFLGKFGIYHSRVESVFCLFVFSPESPQDVSIVDNNNNDKHVLLVNGFPVFFLAIINILCLKLNISNNEVPERCIIIQSSKSNIYST